VASGPNSGATRQPTNTVECHREILQSLTDQGRELESRLKQIGEKLENFKRSCNGLPRGYSQESGREVCTQNEDLDTESSQARACLKQMRDSGRPTSEVNVDTEVSQQLCEAKKPQSVLGKAGKFYQCDSDVVIKCVAGNRYSQLSCDRSSDSTSSGSDDNEDDVCLRDSRRRYQADKDNSKQDSDRNRQRRTVTRTSPRRVSYRDRNEHQSRDRSNWIKPEKFNGHGSFETFLLQFENCASYNKWSSADKAAHLRWSLTGTAAQLLWGSENLSYEDLLDKLKHFSGKGMEEKFQTALWCRRRNRGESLRELFHDIRRLMTLSYPWEQSSLSEHIARDAYLSALADPEFELKIREREPVDLDDALRIAHRYEVFKGAVDLSISTRPRLNRRAAEAQVIDGSSSRAEKRLSSNRKCGGSGRLDDDDLRWKEEVLKRLDELQSAKHMAEQQADRLTAQNAALSKGVERLSYQVQLHAVPSQVANTELLQSKEMEGMRYPRTKRTSGLCYKCGQAGHFQRNCPLREKIFGQRQGKYSAQTRVRL